MIQIILAILVTVVLVCTFLGPEFIELFLDWMKEE